MAKRISENPHFFKIIPLDHHAKLSIPRKFARNYGHHLSNRVMLKVPNGAKWQVDIITSDGDIWLQSGWPKFAEYYSLVEGSFLVFEFVKSHSEFNVFIFDKTAIEIDYPNVDQEQVPNVVHVVEDDDVSVEILDHFSPSTRTKPKFEKTLNLRCSKGDRKQPIEIEGEINGEDDDDVSVEILDHSSPSRKTKVKSPILLAPVPDNRHCPTNQDRGYRKQTIEKESRNKEQTLSFSNDPPKKAKKLTFANPSFRAKISSDCFSRRRLFISTSFFNNIEKGTKSAMLEVNNTLWPVKLLIYPHRCRTILSGGWDAFLRDNSLKLGDVCTFEIINCNDQTLLIKVSITRDSGIYWDAENLQSQVPTVEETRTGICVEIPSKRKDRSPLSSSCPPKKIKKIESLSMIPGKGTNTKEKKEKSKAIHRGRSSSPPEIPTFEIKMQPAYVHSKGNPDIPVRFARKYMIMKDGDALFSVLNSKTWCVKYYTKRISGYTKTRFMLSGWKEFAQENHLEVGDVCKFELIDPHKTLFRVVISRSGR